MGKKDQKKEKKHKKSEEEIDEELKQTFPASDPPSYTSPGNDGAEEGEWARGRENEEE